MQTRPRTLSGRQNNSRPEARARTASHSSAGVSPSLLSPGRHRPNSATIHLLWPASWSISAEHLQDRQRQTDPHSSTPAPPLAPEPTPSPTPARIDKSQLVLPKPRRILEQPPPKLRVSEAAATDEPDESGVTTTTERRRRTKRYHPTPSRRSFRVFQCRR